MEDAAVTVAGVRQSSIARSDREAELEKEIQDLDPDSGGSLVGRCGNTHILNYSSFDGRCR